MSVAHNRSLVVGTRTLLSKKVEFPLVEGENFDIDPIVDWIKKNAIGKKGAGYTLQLKCSCGESTAPQPVQLEELEIRQLMDRGDLDSFLAFSVKVFFEAINFSLLIVSLVEKVEKGLRQGSFGDYSPTYGHRN